jgi:hypothetical protein
MKLLGMKLCFCFQHCLNSACKTLFKLVAAINYTLLVFAKRSCTGAQPFTRLTNIQRIL